METIKCDHRALTHLADSPLWSCDRCGRELWLDEWQAIIEGQRDPRPWKHVGGERVADIAGPSSPKGGYTYLPRPGFADYADRYISTRAAITSR